MEEINLEVINIDNKDYIILDKLTDNNNTYYYLSNEEDKEDFFIQKIDKNNKDQIIPLESKEEFNKAMELYREKYN